MSALYAIERVIPYPTGENTGEVAEQLEERYHIVEGFINSIENELERRFYYFMERDLNLGITQALEKAVFYSNQWLTDEWRRYIEENRTGYITKASKERGSASFIDTARYYLNMKFEIRLNNGN